MEPGKEPSDAIAIQLGSIGQFAIKTVIVAVVAASTFLFVLSEIDDVVDQRIGQIKGHDRNYLQDWRSSILDKARR